MTRSSSAPWREEKLMLLVLMGCLCLFPGVNALNFSPFVDPDCTEDCSWTYLDENHIRRQQFCEMISDAQDGLLEECPNPFQPSKYTRQRPAKPLILRLHDFDKMFNLSGTSAKEVVQHTCINITYNLDENSAEKVKGLQVTLRGTSGKDLSKYYCVNLNFSQTGLSFHSVLNQKGDRGNLSFSCFCGLRPGEEYQVTLRTMPVDIIGLDPYDTIKIIHYTLPACHDVRKKNDARCRKSDAALWGPQCISVRQDISTHSHQGDYSIVDVIFEQAPASFHFDMYDVHIYMYTATARLHVDTSNVHVDTAPTLNGTCMNTSNVTFIAARFNTALGTNWPVTSTFYAIIQPVPKAIVCKEYDDRSTPCRRSFSEHFSIIEDPCLRNPCQGYGQCVSIGDNYTCRCQPGFMFWNGTCTANPCLLRVSETDEVVCGAHGLCNISATQGYLTSNCVCDPGYSLQNSICKEDLCLRNPCQGYGQCVSVGDNYTCRCQRGFMFSNGTCTDVGLSPWIILVIVAGCLAGLLLFLAVFCLRHVKERGHNNVQHSVIRESDDHECTSIQNDFQSTGLKLLDSINGERCVLPIFSEDHPKHSAVVLNLCRLLQTHCQCEVLHPSWCGPMAPSPEIWLSGAIERADLVLLLCSKGTGLKFAAKATQSKLPNTSASPYGDIFLKALTQLDAYFDQNNANQKFVVAYFDYSCEEDIPATFKRFSRYRLMQCIEDLYLRIHDKVRESPHSSRRARAVDKYHQFETGKILWNSINDMKELIETEQMWYQNYNRRHSSNVSGYCSADDNLQYPRAPMSFYRSSEDIEDDDFDKRLKEFQMTEVAPSVGNPVSISRADQNGLILPTEQVVSDHSLPIDSGLGSLPSDFCSHLQSNAFSDSQV